MMTSTVDLPERMQVMFQQEAGPYRTRDYLRELSLARSAAAVDGNVFRSYDGMDPTWRQTMVQWAYDSTY